MEVIKEVPKVIETVKEVVVEKQVPVEVERVIYRDRDVVKEVPVYQVREKSPVRAKRALGKSPGKEPY